MKEGKRLSEDVHCVATDVPQAGLPRVEFDEFAGTGYDEWKEAAIAALKGAPFEKSDRGPMPHALWLQHFL